MNDKDTGTDWTVRTWRDGTWDLAGKKPGRSGGDMGLAIIIFRIEFNMRTLTRTRHSEENQLKRWGEFRVAELLNLDKMEFRGSNGISNH